jgi:predicted GIY-YIG superfamily endonuclease
VNNEGMRETKMPGIYIMGNDRPTLYVGVTNYLPIRVLEHKQGKGSQFTKKYKLTLILYFMTHDVILSKNTILFLNSYFTKFLLY